MSVGRSLRCLAAVGLALVGCGGTSAEQPVGPSTPAEAAAARSTSVYSLAIDPGDGTLLVTAGPFLYRLAPGATELERLEPRLAAGPGEGRIKDLVLRFTDSGKLLASGHAYGAPLPDNVGLMSSDDAGLTWAPVSGIGEADYHEIELRDGILIGLRSDSPGVRVSTDRGRTFDTRKPPAESPPIDVAIDPKNAERLALSSNQGVFISTNGGRSWRQRDTTSGTRLAWVAADALYSAGMDGKIRLSTDGGRAWKETGTIGAGPKEFVAAPTGELHAVIASGEIRRSMDGGATWSSVAKLQ